MIFAALLSCCGLICNIYPILAQNGKKNSLTASAVLLYLLLIIMFIHVAARVTVAMDRSLVHQNVPRAGLLVAWE